MVREGCSGLVAVRATFSPMTAEPIAIVGAACRFPGAPDLDGFWNLLVHARDAVAEVPRERWDADALYSADPLAPGKINTRRAALLERIDTFDPGFFHISPR